MMPAISIWKPPGWHRMETLDAYLYRCAEAIDGVAELQEHFLMEEISDGAKPALIAVNELLFRLRDELYNLSICYKTAEDEGI